jgi:hypothetical protein
VRLGHLEFPGVRGKPAVQQRGLVADDPEHPHQPGRVDATGVVVRDDRVLVPDTECRQAGGERLRLGQRVPAVGRGAGPGEHAIEVDEDGARQMAVVIGGATGPAVEVPAHVGEYNPAGVGTHPLRADDRIDHSYYSPSVLLRRGR